tara:strand:+ start:388 stop:1440 length:1053 start_codon:yes stop_codon:yes gene_type:complete
MPQATSYSLGDAKSVRGARESLDNTLRRTAVEATPMFAMLSRGPKAKAMLSEWMVDDLSEVNFPGIVDGAPLAFDGGFADKTTDRCRFGNRIQQLQRTFSVSPQAEAVDVAGPSGLYATSKARSLIELKRDIEGLICSDTEMSASAVAGGVRSGDTLGGLGAWTDPANAVAGGVYDSALQQGYRSVTGSRFDLTTAGSMTEANLRGVLQAIFEEHGSASSYKLVGGPGVLNQIADMTRTSIATDNPSFSLTQNVGDGVLKLQVQEYISDWGRVYLIPTLLNGRTSGGALNNASRNRAYIIPSDNHVSIRFLEDIRSIDLDDVDGAGKRGLVRTMLTVTPTSAGKPLGSII